MIASFNLLLEPGIVVDLDQPTFPLFGEAHRQHAEHLDSICSNFLPTRTIA
jgi:hypothetical protein